MMLQKVTIISIALYICGVQGSVSKTGKVFPGSEYRGAPDLETSLNEYMKNPQNFIQWIVPGTKWCGDGTIAEDYDDLGIFADTDKCCRTHDHCDDIILSGDSEHGLTNEGKFTRLCCECDLEFYNCLKTVKGNTVSSVVGVGYFNVMGAKCFEENYEATCIEYDKTRCLQYEYDEKTSKAWQWFDVPLY